MNSFRIIWNWIQPFSKKIIDVSGGVFMGTIGTLFLSQIFQWRFYRQFHRFLNQNPDLGKLMEKQKSLNAQVHRTWLIKKDEFKRTEQKILKENSQFKNTNAELQQQILHLKKILGKYKQLSERIMPHFINYHFISIQSAKWYTNDRKSRYQHGSYTWKSNGNHEYTGQSNIYRNYKDKFAKMKKTMEQLQGSSTKIYLKAQNNILGDSCIGHDKRLLIQYKCEGIEINKQNEIKYILKSKRVNVKQHDTAILDCYQNN